MPQNHVKRTVTALSQVISEIENLHAHPRVQQKTWVASAARWLPILHESKAQLEESSEPTVEAQAIWDALKHAGLQVHRQDNIKWSYEWSGEEAAEEYDTPTQAVEAAIRQLRR